MRACVVCCEGGELAFVACDSECGRWFETYNVLVCALYALEASTVFIQLCPEILQSLLRLFRLCLHRFLSRKLAIVVDGARECCKGGVELGLQVWRGRG